MTKRPQLSRPRQPFDTLHATAEVPGVVGADEQYARGVLVGTGFQVEISREPSPQEPGTVLAQDPSAGELADTRTVVQLVVSQATTTTTTRTPSASTWPSRAYDSDAVATLRRLSDEISQGEVTSVDFQSDAEIVERLRSVCENRGFDVNQIGYLSTIAIQLAF